MAIINGILQRVIPEMANDYIQLALTYVSSSIADNTTTVNWALTFYTTTHGGIITVNDRTYQVGIAGQSYSGTFNFGKVNGNDVFNIASGTTVIPHNNDGTKTFEFGFVVQMDVLFDRLNVDYISAAQTATLDPIPRKATITKAPNFTDEESPTIKYTNQFGNNAYKLQAGISLSEGAYVEIPYRDIDKTSGSYTFEFTDDERDFLRNYDKYSNTLPLRYYLRVYYNESDYLLSGVSATMTIVNNTPTITAAIQDTNAATVAVTGSDQVIVKGMSDITYTITAAALKGADVRQTSVQNGTARYYGDSGTIKNPVNGTFLFATMDTRGNGASTTLTKTYVEYTKPTLTLTVTQPEPDGSSASFSFSGTYFTGSFGKMNNAKSVQYRYKDNAGDYGSWTDITTTDSNGNFSGSGTINGLNYENSYTLQVKVADRLVSEIREAQILVRPIFSWSKNDFEFGVPVTAPTLNATNLTVANEVPDLSVENLTIDGRGFGSQVILWQGVNQLGVNDAVVLNDSIANQPNGIILIFSLYREPQSESGGYADDVSLHSFFISKKEVELFPGKPHTFILGINAGLSVMGAKYVYIKNSMLEGHLNNMASNTAASNIKFNNDQFVLRYVLGV